MALDTPRMLRAAQGPLLREVRYMADRNLAESVEPLSDFLPSGSLTAPIANLEHRLDGLDGERIEVVVREGGDVDLLGAAIVVRQELGRISDLIHAAAIVLALPHLMGEGERLTNRPSLAAGNDPTRPYDVETNLRVAEFKLSHWASADAMRKRQTSRIWVHLAADTSGRQPEL
jgi:hypothetical protein